MKYKQKFCLILLLFCFYGLAFAQSPCGGPPDQVPPAESCPEACIYCDFTGYMGTTAGYAPNGIPPGGFCSMIQNDQWLGFVAGAASATFTITPSNCANGNGIQVAFYESCSTAPIACNAGGAGQGNTPTIMTLSMLPGTNYFLLIDGLSGDECDISISVSPPTAGIGPKMSNMLPIQGPATVCPGGTIMMEVPSVTNAGAYTWSGPAGTLINGEPVPVSIDAPDGRMVQVTFPATAGAAQICVNANNSCNNGPTQCRNINVQPILPTVVPTQVVCFENLPYILPWGDEVQIPGDRIYQAVLTSWQGCDSLVRQRVIAKPENQTSLGLKYVCARSAYSVCGQTFTQSGPIEVKCKSYQGCDSLVTGNLILLSPIAKILNKGGFACSGNTTSKTLYSAPSMSGTIKRWSRNGSLIGAGDSIKITQPGIYILVSKMMFGGIGCEVSDTANIIVGTAGQPPVLQTNVLKSITCLNKEAFFGVASNPPALSYTWSGPGLDNFSGPNIKTSQGGEYNVTVVDINGCTNTAKVIVPVDTLKPQVLSITKSPLGGIGAIKGRLITKVNIPNARFSWEGPNLYTNTFQNPLVYGFGTYTVTVTNPTNGCTTTATFEFTDKNKPGINEPTEKETAIKSAPQIHEWHLFPNPSTGFVNITYKGTHLPENVQFKVYDALGKLVFQSASNGSFIQNISLQNATPGLYVLEITQTGDEAVVPERLRFVVK